MQQILKHLRPLQWGIPAARAMSALPGASGLEWLSGFVNYEKQGVPKHAGMDTDEGFDLGRMRRLLARLGDPHKQWAAVHVAGTKGKGSTTALIASILFEAGYNVGSYTSPHVAAFNERIAVNGLPIATPALEDLINRHRHRIEAAQSEEGGALTHFEVVTALAYKHFQEEELGLAVVEVGLGGARDATNVIDADTLRVAVITSIGTDHKAALGDTIEEIAAAKAGIIKDGRPVVLARQPHHEAERVVLERAALLGCPVILAAHEVEFDPWGPEFVPGEGFRDGSEMHLEGPTVAALLDAFTPSSCDVTMRLIGPHQGDNAAAALVAAAVLKRQGFHRITLQAAIDGLAEASLPGRFQVCQFAPAGMQRHSTASSSSLPAGLSRDLAAGAEGSGGSGGGGSDSGGSSGKHSGSGSRGAEEGLQETGWGHCEVPQEPWVVLDGAHTTESAAAVTSTLREMFPHNPLALVIAMAGDKEHTEFMGRLRATHPNVVVFTEVDIAGGKARSAPPGALTAAWQAAGIRVAPPSPKGLRTRVLIQASLAAAVEKARMELAALPGQGVICITGSMHAVGAALRQLDLVPS